MKRLIVNADDYGFTEGISRGIVEACQKGIVRSISILMTHVKKKDLAALKELKGVSFGVHLNLTSGKPLLAAREVPSLVDEYGQFYKRWEQLEKRVNLRELEKELTAQMDAFASSKLPLCHLDSHHHVHSHERLLALVMKWARKLGVALRSPTRAVCARLKAEKIPTTDAFLYDFYDEPHITLEGFKGILDRLHDGATELACHPGIVGDDLFLETTYSYQRGIELATLTHDESAKALKTRKIRLISYCELSGKR
ncbi:MAG: carbohydrate deacetylase [bacterium]